MLGGRWFDGHPRQRKGDGVRGEEGWRGGGGSGKRSGFDGSMGWKLSALVGFILFP